MHRARAGGPCHDKVAGEIRVLDDPRNSGHAPEQPALTPLPIWLIRLNGLSVEGVRTGVLTGVNDGDVLNIQEQLTINLDDLVEDDSDQASTDDDLGDTFWLQLAPLTPGVTLESADGTDFTQPYPVPEPTTFTVFVLVGGVSSLARRRRRSSP